LRRQFVDQRAETLHLIAVGGITVLFSFGLRRWVAPKRPDRVLRDVDLTVLSVAPEAGRSVDQRAATTFAVARELRSGATDLGGLEVRFPNGAQLTLPAADSELVRLSIQAIAQARTEQGEV